MAVSPENELVADLNQPNEKKKRTELPENVSYSLKVIILFVIYFLTARFGLSISPVSNFATLVWPPTGIALAALLLYGMRLWPGIFLGAFLVNLLMGAPFLAALAIATGNTLETVVGVYLLKRFGFQNSLDRLKDVWLLVGVVAIPVTTISATIGVTSLYLAGIISTSSYFHTWLAWWVGDTLGDLIIAPFLLLWLASPFHISLSFKRSLELALVIFFTAAISVTLFGHLQADNQEILAYKYLLFPPLLWTALRFGRRIVVSTMLAVAAFAVWSTLSGFGPFVEGSTISKLLQLQTFMAALAVSTMVLASVVAERRKAGRALEETLGLLEEKVKTRTHELNIIIDELRREVTERRKAHQKLEHNRMLLDLLQDITDAANQTFDVNDAMQIALDKICTFTGWPVGHVYILDKTGVLQPSAIWHIDDPLRYENFRTLTEATPLSYGMALPGLVLKEGKPVWIMDVTKQPNFSRARVAVELNVRAGFAFPILIEGEIVAVLEFFSPEALEPDAELLEIMYNIGKQLGRVFERQRALDSIRASEERFRAVSETANEAIITSDSSGRIYYANKSAEKYFGYTLSEMVGEPVTILMPEEYAALHTEGFGRYMETGVSRIIGRTVSLAGKRKNGLKFPIEISLSKWETSEGIYFTAMIRDITERKEAEESLRSREKQLNEAQQMAHLGNFEWDILRNKVHWSDEMYRIYGIDREEFGHTFEDFMRRVHPDERQSVKGQLESAFRNARAFSLDERIIRPDRTVRTLHTRGEFVKDESGKPVKLIGVCHDITEIKQAEDELRKTYEKLRETQSELIHAEKLAALGRFSSGIAHEIRNPLANISALAQIVMAKSNVDKQLKKHLKYILVNTDIANKIIRDLLNFASPDDVKFHKGNVGKILGRVCDIAKPRCAQNKVKLEKKIKKNIPPILLSEKRMETAFLNFISNSIDAMPKGGTLKVSADFITKENKILVTFSDKGIGIPPESIDKILEPFYTTKDEGTGLGMSMAYQVIKSHRGELDITSTVNKGTKITVSLPTNQEIKDNGKNISSRR